MTESAQPPPAKHNDLAKELSIGPTTRQQTLAECIYPRPKAGIAEPPFPNSLKPAISLFHSTVKRPNEVAVSSITADDNFALAVSDEELKALDADFVRADQATLFVLILVSICVFYIVWVLILVLMLYSAPDFVVDSTLRLSF